MKEQGRRTFLRTTLSGTMLLPAANLKAGREGPLVAYVGTFSSPLKDVLPTQVDLPPGNGRGIHIFHVDRTSGAMTSAGLFELGTSPSCLAVNATGDRLYSANETDRVGERIQGTVSAFTIAGWQCPSAVTATPLAKSMYIRPSWSHTREPSPRTGTNAAGA